MVEPIRRSVSWTRNGTPEDALSVVEAYAISHLGRRIRKSGSQLTINFGSRLAYKLMGVSTDRIPYTVRVSAAANQGTATELTAEAFSNEGRLYIYRPESATRLYEQLLSQVLSELQQQ